VSAAIDENCIFCKIARGDFGTEFVAQNERCAAFRDIDPKAPVHVLVIPKTHIASVSDLDDAEIAGDLLTLCAEVARISGVAESGYRILSNIGPDAGQSVHHVHFHVVGGRKMGFGLD
jgi:histidine triad (HIT) family protein